MYSVMEEARVIKSMNQFGKFSISILGQKKAGKTSLRKMLNDEAKDSNKAVHKECCFVQVGSFRTLDLDIYEGPGFHSK